MIWGAPLFLETPIYQLYTPLIPLILRHFAENFPNTRVGLSNPKGFAKRLQSDVFIGKSKWDGLLLPCKNRLFLVKYLLDMKGLPKKNIYLDLPKCLNFCFSGGKCFFQTGTLFQSRNVFSFLIKYPISHIHLSFPSLAERQVSDQSGN